MLKIKLFGLAAALFLLLAPYTLQADQAPPKPAGEPVKGLTFLKYDEALKLAQEENKLMMIFFWADWCRYCTKIRKEVFSDDRVREPFERYFVAVSVNLENDPEKLSDQYKPKALPTLAFLRPDGEVLGLLPGFVDLDTFIEIVEFIGSETLKDSKANK